MMTLNMVIIASMIGAGGLGFDVLTALRKLDIGSGLEAGMGIVALAIILDRCRRPPRIGRRMASIVNPGNGRCGSFWLAGSSCRRIAALLFKPLQTWPKAWEISTANFWNAAVTWINKELFDLLEVFRNFALLNVMRPFSAFLASAPWTLIIGSVALGLRAGRRAAGALLRLASRC